MRETVDWKWYTERFDRHERIMHAIKNHILHQNTQYQEARIVDLYYAGKSLILDGDLQSSQIDEFIYHEALVHPAMILCEKPEDVLIIGGGEGATLREVLKYRSIESAIMVDIDRELVNLCAKFLPQWSDGAFNDSRADIIFTDARKWVRETGRKFDVIIHDLTIPREDSPSRKLFSNEFFKLLKNRLKPGGILSVQASKADFANMELFSIIRNTLRSVFKTVSPYSTYIPSFYCEWGYMLASDYLDIHRLNKEEIDRRIDKRMRTDLKFFDGATVPTLFSFPLCARRVMNGIKDIITDNNSVLEEVNEVKGPEMAWVG